MTTLNENSKPEIKYKRFKVAIFCFIINTILFTIGMYHSIDLIQLGTGLSMINAPIYAVIFGDSFRPTKIK